MSFFDGFLQPRPCPPVREQSWAWTTGRTEVPGIAQMDPLVVRADDCAVSFGPFEAYPNGFSVYVQCRLRREPEPAAAALRNPLIRPRRRPEEAPEHPGLRWGLEYPDGRRGATTQLWLAAAPSENGQGALDDDLVYFQITGSKWLEDGNRRWQLPFWVHPLPPAGRCRLHVSWESAGLAESVIEFDGSPLRAAADRAVTLWPDTGFQALPPDVVSS